MKQFPDCTHAELLPKPINGPTRPSGARSKYAVSPKVKNSRPSGSRTTDVMSPMPKFALRLSATAWKSFAVRGGWVEQRRVDAVAADATEGALATSPAAATDTSTAAATWLPERVPSHRART